MNARHILAVCLVCVVSPLAWNARRESRAVETARPESKSPARARETAEITFDTIKFDIAKGQAFEKKMLTKEINELMGRKVRLRGFMLPSFQQTGITQFVLVRDNMECCFGPGAALYDCVVVEMLPGKSADFSIRPIAVEGVFELDEMLDPEGKHLAIYHLDGESVR